MRMLCKTLGALSTNTYILKSAEGTIIIDPADNAALLSSEVRSSGGRLSAILLTHGHFDHLLAAKPLKDEFNCPVYVHRNDSRCLYSVEDNLYLYAKIPSPFYPMEDFELVSNGDELSFSDLKFKVIHTPGHSPGSVCFLCGDELFSGDTLFFESIGRTDFSRSSAMKLQTSIKDKLYKLPPQTKVYPGHGTFTSIGYEMKHNPFVFVAE